MLTFRFNGVSGSMTDSETLTSGMVGKEIQIDLSSEWEGLAKTAVFIAGYTCRTAELIGSTVVIPPEILSSPYKKLRVGVRGDNEDGSLVIPTIMAEGPFILPGADPDGDTGTAEVIPTGGTAEAADIAQGKTAYAGGELITGTLKKADSFNRGNASAGFSFSVGDDSASGSGVSMTTTLGDGTERSIVDADTLIVLSAPLEEFGDADTDQVLEGAVFTSAAGFHATGTLAPAKELSLSGAEVGFAFLTGTNGESGSFVTMSVKLPEAAEAILLGPGSVLTLNAPMSEFGNAAQSDVRSGKTFSSAAGLRASGTLEV